MSTVMPCNSPPCTARPDSLLSTVQPICASTLGKTASPWQESRLKLLMVTLPPVTAAAAAEVGGAEGVGLDGVIQRLIDLPPPAPGKSDSPPGDRDAEICQHLQGQVHVRAGAKFIGHLDFDAFGRQRPDERRGRRLAADFSREGGPAAFEAARTVTKQAAVATLQGGPHA